MSANREDLSDFVNPPPKGPLRRGSPWPKILIGLVFLILLVCFLFPARRSSWPAAARAQCHNNLKQISLALHNYEAAYGTLPPAFTVDKEGRRLHSWRTLLLPFLEREALYRRIALTKPWDDPVNRDLWPARPAVYVCPAEGHSADRASYVALVAPESCWPGAEARRLADVKDEHGLTAAVVEIGTKDAPAWMEPTDLDAALFVTPTKPIKSSHPGGGNVAFLDGAVRFFKHSVSEQVRRALVTIAGGETLSPDAF